MGYWSCKIRLIRMQKLVEQDNSQSSESGAANETSSGRDKPQASARRGPQVQLAPEMLDSDGEELSLLVAESLAAHQPVMGVVIDQVAVEVALEDGTAVGRMVTDGSAWVVYAMLEDSAVVDDGA